MSKITIPKELFTKKNLAAVLYGKKDIRLETYPLPQTLEPNECLIESHSTALCKSDLQLFNRGSVGEYVQTKPFVIGHEPSGTVLAVGSEVKHLQPGDHVAIEPSIPCFVCEFCRKSRYNLCNSSIKNTHGMPNIDGSLRRYYTFHANFCYKLPEKISLEEGALTELLALAVHACRRVRLQIGQNVLVCGAGPVGIMSMVCAKAFGANKVWIIDLSEARLNMAKVLGADGTYLVDISPPSDGKTIAGEIVKQMECNPDVIIECSGYELSQIGAVYAAKFGGKIAIVGLSHDLTHVPLSIVTLRELEIIGVCRVKNDFDLAIHLIDSGKVNVKPLISQRFSIENIQEALKSLMKSDDSIFKVLVQFQD